MNRIILIGNGFDLAHGLKTSYRDFIDDFWKRKSDKIAKEPSSVYEDADIRIEISDGKSLAECWGPSSNLILSYYDFKEHMYHVQTSMNRGYKINPWDFFVHNNKFFERITDTSKNTLDNWVNIENEYYEALKDCIKKEQERYNISNLNQDFKRIKDALELYLKDIQDKQLSDLEFDLPYANIVETIFSDFKKRDFTEKSKKEDFNFYPNSILFLNFNYTSTGRYYSTIDNKNRFSAITWPVGSVDIIYIHGKLGAYDNNPIIFGYGDEQDEVHKEIEKRGGEYLDNVKTINYLKAPNYTNLLNFIESDKYQVFIMGHSCGLSDKTLLNTLFEHENCVSIKPFYYEWEKGRNVENNYNDIVKNIYRCFTDKSLMREKVVNKRYCEPLCK